VSAGSMGVAVVHSSPNQLAVVVHNVGDGDAFALAARYATNSSTIQDVWEETASFEVI
jgi:hypothetical protein